MSSNIAKVKVIMSLNQRISDSTTMYYIADATQPDWPAKIPAGGTRME